MGNFNKKLDDNQMNILLKKEFSHNPLWLTVASEELRVFGDFKRINDSIKRLNETLEGYEMVTQIIQTILA